MSAIRKYLKLGDFMKVLICDDELICLEQLNAYIEEYMQNKSIPCDITATTDPLSILEGNACFDLAFLDIQMPVNGIDLAWELKNRNSKVALFFITNYDEYQDEAMDLRAFRYFEKPFQPERLASGLDKAMEYIDGSYVDLYLYNGGVQKRILADDILYITRENRRTVLVTSFDSFPTRENFEDLTAKLPQLFFYLVHKSFFVNLHFVEQYGYKELIMRNGARIPVAPRKQAAFHKFWYEYLRRR